MPEYFEKQHNAPSLENAGAQEQAQGMGLFPPEPVTQETLDGIATKYEAFAGEVWNTLSRIDVADHIETAEVKKEGRVMYTYQYLSWSWAWAQLMKHFPASEFRIMAEDLAPNGTVMVNTEVVVRKAGQSFVREMWLPVMDKANNSIQNPTSRQVSDARMRCLVKNLAVLGLGLDLWAGSDIPVGTVDDPIANGKLELLQGMFDKMDEQTQKGFLAWLDVESVDQITESQYQKARTQAERKLKAQSK